MSKLQRAEQEVGAPQVRAKSSHVPDRSPALPFGSRLSERLLSGAAQFGLLAKNLDGVGLTEAGVGEAKLERAKLAVEMIVAQFTHGPDDVAAKIIAFAVLLSHGLSDERTGVVVVHIVDESGNATPVMACMR
jgi:hypothetical protein